MSENKELKPNEVEVIRVAVAKIQRKQGKPAPEKKVFTLGLAAINARKSSKKPNGHLEWLGNQGIMLKEDWEAKNFGPYGLKEYFETEGKAELLKSAENTNSALQDALMAKEAEIAALKAQLEAKSSTTEIVLPKNGPISNTEAEPIVGKNATRGKKKNVEPVNE